MHHGDILLILAKKSDKNIAQIASELGMTTQHFARLYRKDVLKDAFLEKICTVLNVKIDEFKPESKKMFVLNNLNNVKLYNINAFASIALAEQQSEDIVEEFYLPGLKGNHIAVHVVGSSMETTLFEGDIVVGKECESLSEIYHNGLYIIIYDGTPLIKRILIEPKSIILYSDNILHKQIFAELDKISKVYKIVRFIRMYK